MHKEKFEDLATFVNGRAFKPTEWSKSGRPIIRIQNLTGSSTTTNYFDGPVKEENLVRRGDLLISWSATLGVFIWDGPESALNQHIFKVQLNKDVDKGYFYFAAKHLLGEMSNMVHGSTMQHVTKDRFETLQIPLPTLPEQKRIAALLEKADRLRRLRRYAREMSEGFLQSVFREMFGDPVRNEKGWDRCEMDDIISESQYGTSHKSNSEGIGYPVIGMGDLSDLGYLDLKDLSYVDLDKAEFKKLKLVHGDIVFNRTNSPDLVGKTALFEHVGDYVMASYLVKLKVTQDILPEFFVALLNTKPYKAMFQKRCKKAVNQANISPTLLKEFPAIKPPFAIQEKFRDVRQQVVRQIVVQKEAERQAEHLFQTLLHRAFAEG